MLVFLDILLTIIHIAVIFSNLSLWIWDKTRKIYFWIVTITLASWLLLGIKYGLGYCFLTDWHWDVKRKLGEQNLPNSFVQYLFETVGLQLQPSTTDIITVAAFIFSITMGIYLGVIKKAK